VRQATVEVVTLCYIGDMLDKCELILGEIEDVLNSSSFDQYKDFMESILTANKIVVFGAGRVGIAMRGFSMRLNHLGLNSFFLGDVNVPNTGASDLLIVGSGSGNTISVADIVVIAKRNNLKVVSITANLNSLIAHESAQVIVLNCQTKESSDTQRTSKQPMTTLFEQSLSIVLDSLILKLMEAKNETHLSMLERHNRLE
jgi:6-phospho-3-hexuloisomerase